MLRTAERDGDSYCAFSYPFARHKLEDASNHNSFSVRTCFPGTVPCQRWSDLCLWVEEQQGRTSKCEQCSTQVHARKLVQSQESSGSTDPQHRMRDVCSCSCHTSQHSELANRIIRAERIRMKTSRTSFRCTDGALPRRCSSRPRGAWQAVQQPSWDLRPAPDSATRNSKFTRRSFAFCACGSVCQGPVTEVALIRDALEVSRANRIVQVHGHDT